MPADTAPAIRLGPSPSPLRTLTLDEAAAFLHMHPEEVRTRTKRGVILDLTRFSGHITVTQRGVQNVEERQ